MSTAKKPETFTSLSGVPLLVAGLALALANFMVVLDITIANVSVPHISGSLAVSPSQGTWVITFYTVAEAIALPLTGWLAGRFGAVRLMLTALAGFGLFSFLCGIAPTFGTLLLCRVLQGFCGGPIIPMSQTLLLRVFPKDKASTALGLWSMTTLAGPIAGPILGGTISDNWTWPWIFFINLPTVLFCLLAGWRLIRRFETPTTRAPIDYIGLILLIIWVSALQVLLDKGREADWFSSSLIVTLGIIAAIGFVSFLIWELTEQHPIVDLKVLRHRGFTVTMATQSIGFGAFFGGVVVLPLWLQTNLGYTATLAGYSTAFLGILAVVLSPWVAGLFNRFDARVLIMLGTLWLGALMLARTQWFTNIDFVSLAIPQFLQGMGLPFFIIGTSAVALGSVLPGEVASAAGVLNFSRILVSAIAASITTTVWENSTASNHEALAGILNRPDTVMAKLEGVGLSGDQARAMIDRLTQTEAVTLATNHVFMLLGMGLIISALLILLAPKPAKTDADMSTVH